MQREYGIDLLKIVAMLFIVLDHILYWGGWGFCAGQTGVKGLVLGSLDAVCLCHVNCFVLASGWVMSRLNFKFKRVVKLWLQVWGYSLAFLVLVWICFPSIKIDLKDVIRNLLPISMDRYWFFTQYTILFFAMPLLNVAIKNLDRKVLLLVLWVGLFCFSIHPFVFKTDMFHLNRGYSALWFMYLYLLAGTMAVRRLFADFSIKLVVLAAMVGIAGGIASFYFRDALLFGMARNSFDDLYRSYNSPFILVYSVATLMLFSRMKTVSNRIRMMISFMAPSVFAVYIIHSNKLFRAMTDWNIFWSRYLDCHSTAVCVLGTATSAALIFIGCIIIDIVRKRVVSMIPCRLIA